MANYTSYMKELSEDIDLLDLEYDECQSLLEEAMCEFRTFDCAITDFISKHGYLGDINNEKEKTQYIFDKFQEAGINIQKRVIKDWFTLHKGIIKYPTGYYFCFAFHLNVDESNDFFRRICLDRGFDCRVKEEAIYYFCIKNELSFCEAQGVIERVNNIKESNACENMPYTQIIKSDVDNIDSLEGLYAYICENITYFDNKSATASRNVTAMDTLRVVWNEISSPEGLANTEVKKNFFDTFAEELEIENHIGKRGTWPILDQIFGTDMYESEQIKSDRSIKSLIKNNSVIHKFIEEMFPDKQAIDEIVSGNKQVKPERMRKSLLLLLFYRYWIRLAIRNEGYESSPGDAERCIASLNQYLVESGFHELYYGNPYDWLFLLCIYSEKPLASFREYINIARVNNI